MKNSRTSRAQALLNHLLPQDQDLEKAKKLEDHQTWSDLKALPKRLKMEPMDDEMLWMGKETPEAW